MTTLIAVSLILFAAVCIAMLILIKATMSLVNRMAKDFRTALHHFRNANERMQFDLDVMDRIITDIEARVPGLRPLYDEIPTREESPLASQNEGEPS